MRHVTRHGVCPSIRAHRRRGRAGVVELCKAVSQASPPEATATRGMCTLPDVAPAGTRSRIGFAQLCFHDLLDRLFLGEGCKLGGMRFGSVIHKRDGENTRGLPDLYTVPETRAPRGSPRHPPRVLRPCGRSIGQRTRGTVVLFRRRDAQCTVVHLPTCRQRPVLELAPLPPPPEHEGRHLEDPLESRAQRRPRGASLPFARHAVLTFDCLLQLGKQLRARVPWAATGGPPAH